MKKIRRFRVIWQTVNPDKADRTYFSMHWHRDRGSAVREARNRSEETSYYYYAVQEIWIPDTSQRSSGESCS